MIGTIINSRPFAFEQLTATTGSAVAFNSDLYMDKNQTTVAARQPATVAVVSVTGNPIRYRIDGTAPDSSTGHLVPVGAYFLLSTLTAISQFKAIGIGGSASVSVTFFQA